MLIAILMYLGLALLFVLALCRAAARGRTAREQAAEDAAQARALSMDDLVRAYGGEGL